jgi:hypothetical protein
MTCTRHTKAAHQIEDDRFESAKPHPTSTLQHFRLSPFVSKLRWSGIMSPLIVSYYLVR